METKFYMFVREHPRNKAFAKRYTIGNFYKITHYERDEAKKLSGFVYGNDPTMNETVNDNGNKSYLSCSVLSQCFAPLWEIRKKKINQMTDV